MGTLYREVVEYKYNRFLKHIVLAAIIILSADIIYLITDLKEIIEELLYVGYGLMPAVILIALIAWGKSKRRYRYVIIDNELIIEKLNGNKRKPILNLNIKQIVKLEKVSSKAENSEVEKQYNFTCTLRNENLYKCIFNKDGRLFSFYFEPSSKLISKIRSMSQIKITA